MIKNQKEEIFAHDSWLLNLAEAAATGFCVGSILVWIGSSEGFSALDLITGALIGIGSYCLPVLLLGWRGKEVKLTIQTWILIALLGSVTNALATRVVLEAGDLARSFAASASTGDAWKRVGNELGYLAAYVVISASFALPIIGALHFLRFVTRRARDSGERQIS